MRTLLLIILTLIINLNAESYERPNWNGCKLKVDNVCLNTVNAVLYKTGFNVKIISKGKVVAGTWYSFYSGTKITDPKLIEINHVLPFSWMLKNGLCEQSEAIQKRAYNDYDNLVITTTKENRLKSDKLELPFKVDHDSVMHLYEFTKCNICNKYNLNNCKQFCSKLLTN